MIKRLFWGMEVHAPWPEKLPFGRLLDPEHRHLTLAFLGNIDFSQMQEALPTFPPPLFTLGFAATFDQCLFLPPHHPHVVAWHLKMYNREEVLLCYQKMLVKWLEEKGIPIEAKHPFTPHVTICRSPFKERAWQRTFTPLPLVMQQIHLYESLGDLKYKQLWSFALLPPFEEVEHTADLSYLVRGETYEQLFYHAAIALCFHFPSLVTFIPIIQVRNLEEIVMALNHMIYEADSELGCPFKAVSFHSELTKEKNYIEWMMIIDV